MTARTLTPGPLAALTDDIRQHGYAIVQTHIERAPTHLRSARCGDPDGCARVATLLTLALAEVSDEKDAVGLRFERDSHGELVRLPVCDEHRTEASHDLYYAFTGRTRPDGIRAFDVPGQHMQWT
ncbi:hypothetical protein [Streptomyces sp. NPDC055140]